MGCYRIIKISSRKNTVGKYVRFDLFVNRIRVTCFSLTGPHLYIRNRPVILRSTSSAFTPVAAYIQALFAIPFFRNKILEHTPTEYASNGNQIGSQRSYEGYWKDESLTPPARVLEDKSQSLLISLQSKRHTQVPESEANDPSSSNRNYRSSTIIHLYGPHSSIILSYRRNHQCIAMQRAGIHWASYCSTNWL